MTGPLHRLLQPLDLGQEVQIEAGTVAGPQVHPQRPLLGVKAVVAKSFERIHRSNLIGMGVLPLQFKEGVSDETLGLNGAETFSLLGLGNDLKPGQTIPMEINRPDGTKQTVDLVLRIDTEIEVDYYRHGGILQYVLRDIVSES